MKYFAPLNQLPGEARCGINFWWSLPNIHNVFSSGDPAEFIVLPLIPNLTRNNRPHDSPVPESALVMPLGKLFRLVGSQNSHLFARRESRQGHFVLWNEELPSGNTFQVVRFYRFPKPDLVIGL